MSSAGDEVKNNNVYSFKVPPAKPSPPPYDETGAMVGSVLACLIISAVFFFLWKMLQRKKREMQQKQLDIEQVLSEVDALSINTLSDQKTTKVFESPKRKSTRQVGLPHSTMKSIIDFDIEEEDDGDDYVDVRFKEQMEELILPPLSPIVSSTWSQKEDMESSDTIDTGYNSGYCRKNGVLRQRIKGGPDDLYMEHPRDIIKSLTHDCQQLLKQKEKRDQFTKQTINTLEESLDLLKSTENTFLSISEKAENMRQLKTIRKQRRRIEVERNQSKRWHLSRWSNRDEKEAFVAMQECFDGLQLRTSITEIAEQVFLLRSQHRSDIDKCVFQQQTIKDSIDSIKTCQNQISQLKYEIKRMQNEMEKTLKLVKTETKTKPSSKVPDDKTYHQKSNARERERRNRIMLTKATRKNTVAPDDKIKAEPIPTKADVAVCMSERCPNCNRYFCQCQPKKKSQAEKRDSHVTGSSESKKHEAEIYQKANVAKTNPLSPLFNRLLGNLNDCNLTEDDKLHEATEKNVNILTLRLSEVVESNSCENNNDPELSEREVKKALNRIPAITALRTLSKGGNNWTIVATSTRERIANIRFNCRGKTYVIGMT